MQKVLKIEKFGQFSWLDPSLFPYLKEFEDEEDDFNCDRIATVRLIRDKYTNNYDRYFDPQYFFAYTVFPQAKYVSYDLRQSVELCGMSGQIVLESLGHKVPVLHSDGDDDQDQDQDQELGYIVEDYVIYYTIPHPDENEYD